MRQPAANPAANHAKAFVAYCHPDEQVARQIADALRSAGFDPFFAPDSLIPGMRWWPAIEAAMRRAQLLVLVLSPESASSLSVFHREVALAVELSANAPEARIHLVPYVVTSDTPIPDTLRDWTPARSMSEIVRAARSLIAGGQPARALSRRRILFAAGAASFTILFSGFAHRWIWPGRDSRTSLEFGDAVNVLEDDSYPAEMRLAAAVRVYCIVRDSTLALLALETDSQIGPAASEALHGLANAVVESEAPLPPVPCNHPSESVLSLIECARDPMRTLGERVAAIKALTTILSKGTTALKSGARLKVLATGCETSVDRLRELAERRRK